MTQTKAAIYCRVSTEMQSEKGYSLQEQERICREYGTKHGYEVVGIFQDDVSGSTFERPGTNQIIEAAKRGEIQRVLVQELDRLARDATALLILEHQLKLYEVQVDYILNNFQPGAVGDFHKNIAVAVSQLEKEQIKARTRRGRMSKVREGKVLSGARAPYGYYFENNMFHIDEEESRIVRLIFDWYTNEKLGLLAIAKKLSAMQIPTRGDLLALNRKKNHGVWGVSTVHKMLQNETYVGRWHFNKTDRKQHQMHDRSEWLEVEVPAIVEESVFNRAQLQKKSNTHYNTRNTKHEYLLTGMITCAHCGRPFLASRKYSTHRVIIYYRCCTQEARYRTSFEEDAPQCRYPYLQGAVVEEIVWSVVSEYIKNPALILEAINQKRETSVKESDTLRLYETTLQAEIESLVAQEKRLLDLFLSSKLDQSLLEGKSEELKNRRESLQTQLNGIKKEYENVVIDDAAAHEIVNYCSIMTQGLDLMTTLERREVLKLLQVKTLVNREARELRISGLLPTKVVAYSTLVYWYEIKHY